MMYGSSPQKEEMSAATTTKGTIVEDLALSHHMELHEKDKKMMIIRYKEWMKNHAASIGGNARDGCGEFIPCADHHEASSSDTFYCLACGCHRNFHRKEIRCSECTDLSSHQHICQQMIISSKLLNKNNHMVTGLPTASQFHKNDLTICGNRSGGSDYGDGDWERNDEQDEQEKEVVTQRKRFRTKFTQEQKEKMLIFAEKAGWSMPKLDASGVQQFCQEIGIKRRVLKVWMHNNKHHFACKLDPAN